MNRRRTRRLAGPRYPLGPLLEVVRRRLGAPVPGHDEGYTDARARAELGVGEGVWRRWRTDGLTDPEADDAATRLGLHPAQVWPHEYALAAAS